MVELVARSIAVSETMIWQEMKMARVGGWEANKNNNTSFGKVRKGGSEAHGWCIHCGPQCLGNPPWNHKDLIEIHAKMEALESLTKYLAKAERKT